MIIITITVLIIRSKAFKAMVKSIKLHDTVIKWFVSLLLVYKYIHSCNVKWTCYAQTNQSIL